MEHAKNKLRILCLHGFSTNQKIMMYQTRQWRNYFKDFVEFDYINGKYEINSDEFDDPGLKKILEKDECVYSWASWSSSDYENQLIRDMQYIVDHIEKEGPYDGLMGFSQGGGMVNSLLQYYHIGKINISSLPKFFIIVNAPFFHLPVGKPQLDIPTLHFISPQDQILYDRPLLMTTFYKNPMIISHSHGHKVPRLEPAQIVDVKKFILNATHQKKNAYFSTQASL
ncbi:hypothetical protein ABPG74_014267 [Tetrahymena malaccensis]